MISSIISLPLYYWILNSDPQSFRDGMAEIKHQDTLLAKTGGYESYTFIGKLPQKTDNPAYFKVAIKGSVSEAFVTVKMTESSGKWIISGLKIDSLRAN